MGGRAESLGQGPFGVSLKTLKRYQTEVVIPRPVKEVWPFFADAHNLEKITPPWLNFKVLSQSTQKIQEGTTFEYKLRVKGFPVKWKSKIINWIDEKQFMDIQLEGPYSRWEHLHTFEPTEGGTLMKDTVDYELPFGALGRIAAGWMVDKDVKTIFEYRKKVIVDIFK